MICRIRRSDAGDVASSDASPEVHRAAEFPHDDAEADAAEKAADEEETADHASGGRVGVLLVRVVLRWWAVLVHGAVECQGVGVVIVAQ